MNCIVCDDDINTATQISNYVKQYAKNNRIFISCTVSTNPLELLDMMNTSSFDLYILDIIMPNINGIELAKKIRKKDKNCVIIFLTNSCDYTKDAFEVDALQYLEKPLNIKKFTAALDRAITFLHSNYQYVIPITTKDGVYALPVCNIVYVESNKHVLYLHLTTGEVITSKTSAHTITQIASQLPFPPFIIPYKGYIVNMTHISYIKKYCFCTSTGTEIPIPVRQFNTVKEQYTNFLLQLVLPAK